MPLFRFKFYFRFLQSVNREVAREVRKIINMHRLIFRFLSQVRDEYVDTMGKIMFSYFKSYTGRLDR